MNSDEMIPDRDSGILDIVDRSAFRNETISFKYFMLNSLIEFSRTNGSRRLIPSQVFHRSEAKGGERLSVQQFLQVSCIARNKRFWPKSS